ncbi:fibronectin type III domain-containing protein, partial [Bacillus cereus]|nr:fibronectin type III domain-containing protein [Bacillus cereus]
MRIKKCFAIFSLMMIMCLSVLPSFASAAVVDLLEGKKGVVKSTGKEFVNMTDGNSNTSDNIRGLPIVFDLGDVYIIDKF